VVAPEPTDDRRTAVEPTGKTEARVVGILRQLLQTYDDVVYRAAPGRPGRAQDPARSRTGPPTGVPQFHLSELRNARTTPLRGAVMRYWLGHDDPLGR